MISMEEEARPKMAAIIDDYGLQITLKTLVDHLQKITAGARGNTPEVLLILETLKGLHAGYCRRYEEETQ